MQGGSERGRKEALFLLSLSLGGGEEPFSLTPLQSVRTYTTGRFGGEGGGGKVERRDEEGKERERERLPLCAVLSPKGREGRERLRREEGGCFLREGGRERVDSCCSEGRQLAGGDGRERRGGSYTPPVYLYIYGVE